MDRSPSAYSQPIPSSQPWCPAGFDNTAMFQPLLESLDRSINLQTANAKDHYISSVKVYDGINPEEFGPGWMRCPGYQISPTKQILKLPYALQKGTSTKKSMKWWSVTMAGIL